MKILNYSKILVVILSIIAVSSCKKQISNQEIKNIAETNEDFLSKVKNHNGILVFQNQEHFNNCRNQLSQKSQVEIKEWLTSIQFKPLSSMINNFNIDMQKLESQFPDIENEQQYNEYKMALQPIKSKYDKFIELDDNGNIIKKNWIDLNIAHLSNLDNTFKVGDTLVYCNDEVYIEVFDGDLNKLRNAISTKIGDSKYVFYSTIQKTLLEKRTRASYNSNTPWGSNGNPFVINKQLNWNSVEGSSGSAANTRRKTSIYLYIYAVLGSAGNTKTYNLILDGYNQRRTTFAGWASTSANNTLTGTYYTATSVSNNIANYYQFAFSAPFYTPYTIPTQYFYNQSYYNYSFGTKSTSHTTGNLFYNFSGNFTATGSHSNGVNVTVPL